MYKFLNILMFLFIVFFIFSVLKFYYSNNNISLKDYNRSNIDIILKQKINNLPVLANDTDNVIEFNNSIENEMNNNKKRNFWNLLKNK